MHYQNGREAKNGDKVVQFNSGTGEVKNVGVLLEATPGNDWCNGVILVRGDSYGPALTVGACLVDCLHVDDVEKHPRPAAQAAPIPSEAPAPAAPDAPAAS